MKEIKDFEMDLVEFIKKHPYVIEQDADPQVENGEDEVAINLHTIDGEYERIRIKILYIA